MPSETVPPTVFGDCIAATMRLPACTDPGRARVTDAAPTMVVLLPWIGPDTGLAHRGAAVNAHRDGAVDHAASNVCGGRKVRAERPVEAELLLADGLRLVSPDDAAGHGGGHAWLPGH